MKVRKTIFDSAAEEALFKSLRGSWEPDFRVFPHLPFTNLVDVTPGRFSAAELEFLHKTTVDYVLTSPEGQPVLAVEFDGLGHGFSQNGVYRQEAPARRDPAREWKLGLKARIADQVRFPFMIVSYDEKAILDPETGLTIAHGLIGQYLAHLHFRRVCQEPLLTDEEAEWLEALPGDERYEYCQDKITSEEVAAEMRWNPIARLDAQLTVKLIGLCPGLSWGYQHLEENPRPPVCDPTHEDFDASETVKWLGNLRRLGCLAYVETPLGRVARAVWIRKIGVLGLDPLGFLNEAAGVLAKRAALTLLRDPDSGIA